MKRITLIVFLLLGFVAYIFSVARMVWAIIWGSDQADHIALSYDQLGNVVFNGSEDETISSRAGLAAIKGRRWACILCRFLDWFQKDHCEKSIGS
jgi:hypothetical protein